ncbi:MAG: response regulator [Desulfobacterales bacterium]|nr:response regulator [Desulfobacterales bacterium]MDX2512248.1 response regulator [Desulfobacterales bacterium]
MTSKSVLIVDDDVHIRRVLEVKLKKYGFQILMAANGQAALDLIIEKKPDVVISDINMPIMDGKTLCKKCDPLKKERTFLTIIITARIDPHEKNWIEKRQDTVLMEKPFSPMEVLNVIQSYLGDSA